jgi:N-acylneuraminate cytidylyltransferase
MENNVVAFIPVRGGSKGIRKKNIKLINGKPLVWYAINAAVNCTEINEVFISTDSEEIKSVVLNLFPASSKVKVIERSEASANDTASTESVMLEFAKNYTFSEIILIQATSPLITSGDLTGGISKYLGENANGLVSVVRQKRFVWDEKNGEGFPVNYSYESRPRRQDFEGFFVENGAFYITSKQRLLDSKCRISEPVVLWEMAEETYFEIDELEDWIIVEKLLERREKIESKNNIDFTKIKLFLTDVDGVLTDAGMFYTEQGDELKKFNTRDGKGFELLRNAGIKTGIITAEDTQIVKRRANKVKADFLYQGVKNKVLVLEEILNSTGFKPEEVAYIGDDLNDVGIISKVGISACPADAVNEVKSKASIVLSVKGGYGAVREFAEKILS